MRLLPKSRAGRIALALLAINELRGLIVAGPVLVALARHWF